MAGVGDPGRGRCLLVGRQVNEPPAHICWDEHGGLYLPPQYAYIGVAMDRRDAADEIAWAFIGARRAREGYATAR